MPNIAPWYPTVDVSNFCTTEEIEAKIRHTKLKLRKIKNFEKRAQKIEKSRINREIAYLIFKINELQRIYEAYTN